jgi:hypothetical protein
VLENYKGFFFRRLVSDERSTKVRFTVVTIILILILFNISFLNYIYISDSKKQPNLLTETTTTSSTTKPSDNLFIPTTTIAPTQTQNIPTINTNKPTVKDYYIPLGSGTGQGTDWNDIPGAQATVDFAQYSPIKEIRLEVSVNIPTGNESVSVRLYNVTDKHPVWYSEVITNNATSYLTSSPIIYDLGSKLYQVQMRTQLEYPANLTQARIHIISR